MAKAPVVEPRKQRRGDKVEDANSGEQEVKGAALTAQPGEGERELFTDIEHLLDVSRRAARPRLVGPGTDGREEIELPETLFHVLREVVHFLKEGKAVTVVPHNQELTTQQAADFLNVSRPFLIKLLEQGHIPFSKVGAHRRIRFRDLDDYRKRRDVEREESLERLAKLTQKAGLYGHAEEFPKHWERADVETLNGEIE